MKARTIGAVFGIEALACIALAVTCKSSETLLIAVATFPFVQLSAALRALSLSGALGNAAALIIYCAVCLAPVAYMSVRVSRRRAFAADALLVPLCALMFAALYMLINPADIARHFGAAGVLPMSKLTLCLTVYTVAGGYAIIRVLRVLTQSDTASMLRYIRLLLCAVCALLVYAICGAGVSGLITAFTELADANTDSALAVSYVFLTVQYIVNVLPYAFGIAIAFTGFGLIEALGCGQYSDGVVPAARAMARVCRVAVIAIILSQAAVNTLQLALGSAVRASHYSLSVPLMPVVSAMAAMLLAHYFEQARALKADNDMII